ncbi:hypothetical protein C8R45DRAFT_1174745 [Mycena sanguinolenta]|nr:hypothetical protein C8R45DRAFT_1174745 [Mycena sanguinolenta]
MSLCCLLIAVTITALDPVFTSNVTHNVYNLPPEQPSEFRTIRLGDVKLVKEVRLSPQSGIVGHQSRGVGVRRIYHAAIRRDPGIVTVAMYQGNGAEDEWRQHVAKYESIRHPYIMQPYGLVSTKEIYAIVFHDELIPYARFLRRFQYSTILCAYIIGYCTTEHEEAVDYIYDVLHSIDLANSPVWIRPSTGELCLDLIHGGVETSSELLWWDAHILRLENVSLEAPDSEDIAIGRFQRFHVSTELPVGPGIFRLDSQRGTCMRITEPLILSEDELHWDHYEGAPGEQLPNLYDSRRIHTLGLELPLLLSSYEIKKGWVAQANRIFTELQEEAHIEDSDYGASLTGPVLNLTSAISPKVIYSFVLFRISALASNRKCIYINAACPAYWPLNPSGAARLSTEDAGSLGFPAIHIETRLCGWSWDRSVYGGLRRLRESKGLDPNSREVARQLGYPLYEVLSDRVPFPARKVEEWSCEEVDPAYDDLVDRWATTCNNIIMPIYFGGLRLSPCPPDLGVAAVLCTHGLCASHACPEEMLQKNLSVCLVAVAIEYSFATRKLASRRRKPFAQSSQTLPIHRKPGNCF